MLIEGPSTRGSKANLNEVDDDEEEMDGIDNAVVKRNSKEMKDES